LTHSTSPAMDFNVIHYHSLFLSFFSLIPSNSLTVCKPGVCVWSCLYLCRRLPFGLILHIWEKACGLSEPGLPCLTWWSPLPFTCKWHNFILFFFFWWD
jgi:hypothetical protein